MAYLRAKKAIGVVATPAFDAPVPQGAAGPDLFRAKHSAGIVGPQEAPPLANDDSFTTNDLATLFIRGTTVAATNQDGDYLSGGGGNDELEGFRDFGIDTLVGGTGDDIYIVTQGDTIIEAAGEGYDIVYVKLDFTSFVHVLSPGAHVELLAPHPTLFENPPMTMNFTSGIRLSGNELDNLIHGTQKSDELLGFGGNDTLVGFNGDDHYYINDLGDTIVEQANGGTHDRIFTTIDYELSETGNVEDLYGNINFNNPLSLAGNSFDNIVSGREAGDIIAGRAGNDDLRGWGGNDSLYGEAGNDILNGGDGIDLLVGGIGDDTYVASTGDTVVEADGEGNDTVRASSHFGLAAGLSIENLATENSNSEDAIDLGGNELVQQITGNRGRNVIYGGGGADVMDGLDGSDTYLITDASAVIIERSERPGRDIVYTSVSYGLGTGVYIEVLSAASLGSTVPLNLAATPIPRKLSAMQAPTSSLAAAGPTSWPGTAATTSI